MTSLFVAISYFMDSATNAIGWCSRTHNFWRGCSAVSEGCTYCYAQDEGGRQIRMNPSSPYQRLVSFSGGRWRWTGAVEPSGLAQWMAPFQTGQRWLAFADSMSDFFHETLPDEKVLFALRVIWRARGAIFQVVTKRAKRMADLMARLHLSEGELHLAAAPLEEGKRFVVQNLWLGVSVENQKRADERLPLLAGTNAVVRFISAEPLLGPVDFSAYVGGFNWVIAGGESGPKFRPMDLDWVLAIRDLCVSNGVPFFFKQMAGANPQFLPKTLDGVAWRQFPQVELLAVPEAQERKLMRAWVEAEYGRVFGP